MSEVIAAGELDWLRARAEEVLRLTRQTAEAVVRIGQILTDVRARLGKNRFVPWVRDTFRWGRSTAYRMIAVAAAFGRVPADTLARFGPSALYQLADRRTPPEVRDAAVAAAAGGRTFGEADARALIRSARPAAAARDTAPRPRRPRPHPAAFVEPAADRPPAEDHTEEVMAARAILALVEEGVVVRVSRLGVLDDDDPAGRPYTCGLYRPGRPPEIAVSRDGPFSAITLAAGTQPTRTCKRCGKTYPLFDGFSRKTGNPYDRSYDCRKCAAGRVGESKKRQRGTDGRSKAEDAAKRERVRAVLAERPGVSDMAAAREAGCSAQLVEKVRADMGVPTRRDRDREKTEAVRRELLADPHRTTAVVAEAAGCHYDTARRVRARMEAAGELEPATERVGRDGVAMQVLPLAAADVRAVPADVLPPATVGAYHPTPEAVA